jgi:hypothetical protein
MINVAVVKAPPNEDYNDFLATAVVDFYERYNNYVISHCMAFSLTEIL